MSFWGFASHSRAQEIKYKKIREKEARLMTVIREKEIIMPKIPKEPQNNCEMFDCGRFGHPAEIFIADDEIAW